MHLPGGRSYRRPAYIQNTIFISSKLVLVFCKIGIYFLSLPSLVISVCFEFGSAQLQRRAISISILPDGNIYAAGMYGCFATFQAPEQLRDDMKKFADRLYNKAAVSAAVASKNASSNDEVNDVVSGSRKRAREEFENEDGTVQGADVLKGNNPESIALKNMEELEKQKLRLVKKEWETEKIVSDLKLQKDAMKTMEEKFENSKVQAVALKEELKKLQLELETQKEAHEEQSKKIMENSKVEAEALKEDLKKLLLELGIQKEAVRKMKENPNSESETKKEDMASMKRRLDLLEVFFLAHATVVKLSALCFGVLVRIRT